MRSLLVEKGMDMVVSKRPTRVNKGSRKEGGEMNYLSGEVLNNGGGGGSAGGGGDADDADSGSYRLIDLLTVPSDALERGRRRRWKRRRYDSSDDGDDEGGGATVDGDCWGSALR